MNSMILSEKEIKCIKSFIKKASNINVVECIYLVPYFSTEKKEEKVDVVAIWNESLYYNGLITGEEKMRDTKSERASLKETVEEYQQKSNNSRLYFSTNDDENYSLALMHRREWFAEMELVDGTILFDRFGDKTDNRNRALNYFKQHKNILEIENIDRLITMTKNNPTLKRTKQ